MQNKRRAHVGPLVLIYSFDGDTEVIRLLEFEHHDKAYE